MNKHKAKAVMTRNKFFTIVFHAVCWILVTLPSVTFVPMHIEQTVDMTLIHLSMPLFLCVIFYMNYLWLVPRCLMQRRVRVYACVNVVVVVVLAVFMQVLSNVLHTMEFEAGFRPPPLHEPDGSLLMYLLRSSRNVMPFILSIALATLLRMAMRWQATEAARKEMEKQKVESELRNLQNQINPHFLLNTLNNIYALISFDSDKAQRAVLSLSALLRQMLYGGKKASVSIKGEADFIRNYVELMKLRLNKNVKIDFNVRIPDGHDVYMAPFILISLVENAFKHGVSPTEPSFISISIMAGDGKIECEIKNSNHPKSSSDKSGHGIGLEQVARRLDLAYAGRYEWQRGVDRQNNVYYSKIIIYDTDLCNHR